MDEVYRQIRDGRAGFYQQPRGLIVVSGSEAVPFLDGMITNDVKTLADNAAMLAAFPTAQGRLLAVARVLRRGDRFLIETEETTREKLFQNLFRFTFAGDFFVADISDAFSYFEVFDPKHEANYAAAADKWSGSVAFALGHGAGYFIPSDEAARFREFLASENGCVIDHGLYETLRIEGGIPRYGVDMDDTTIVPELGLDRMISYDKGCYVGQEIIARIHFRGHVAKRLTGLVSASGLVPGTMLAVEDKNAGKITSATFSPSLGRHIALGFVRWEHLAAGTLLNAGGANVVVTTLPFVHTD